MALILTLHRAHTMGTACIFTEAGIQETKRHISVMSSYNVTCEYFWIINMIQAEQWNNNRQDLGDRILRGTGLKKEL